MSDRLIAVALLVGCGFLYWQTYSVKKPPFAAFESFDAVTFPRAVLIVLALFALVLLVRGAGTLVPRHPTRDDLRLSLSRYRPPLISLPAFGLYAAAMPAVGWFVDTAAYLIAIQLVLQPAGSRPATPAFAATG